MLPLLPTVLPFLVVVSAINNGGFLDKIASCNTKTVHKKKYVVSKDAFATTKNVFIDNETRFAEIVVFIKIEVSIFIEYIKFSWAAVFFYSVLAISRNDTQGTTG